MGVSNLFEGKPGWTNQKRAETASKAAYEYADGGLPPDEHRPANIDLADITREDIVDLMADLCHLADRIGLDARQTMQIAEQHFREEKHEEYPDPQNLPG